MRVSPIMSPLKEQYSHRNPGASLNTSLGLFFICNISLSKGCHSLHFIASNFLTAAQMILCSKFWF